LRWLGDMDKLTKVKAPGHKLRDPCQMDWQPIGTAPFDRDLELAVVDDDGLHALVFPCRRLLRGWVKAKTDVPVNVHPTHWREWNDAVSRVFSDPGS
jgi:hypothetical protein